MDPRENPEAEAVAAQRLNSQSTYGGGYPSYNSYNSGYNTGYNSGYSSYPQQTSTGYPSYPAQQTYGNTYPQQGYNTYPQQQRQRY